MLEIHEPKNGDRRLHREAICTYNVVAFAIKPGKRLCIMYTHGNTTSHMTGIAMTHVAQSFSEGILGCVCFTSCRLKLWSYPPTSSILSPRALGVRKSKAVPATGSRLPGGTAGGNNYINFLADYSSKNNRSAHFSYYTTEGVHMHSTVPYCAMQAPISSCGSKNV